MCAESLWGDFSRIEKIRTPTAILKAQADILSKETKGILVGEVSQRSQKSGDLLIHFNIVAPLMNSYKFSILRIHHDPVQIYPLQFDDLINDDAWTIDNEDVFNEALADLLQSDGINSVISSLISQSST